MEYKYPIYVNGFFSLLLMTLSIYFVSVNELGASFASGVISFLCLIGVIRHMWSEKLSEKND